jgi:hypothetical protein
VLARQRVIRAELGEDRDHDAAQQVLAILILLRREDLLKAL